jgi:hypothetical protein
VRKPHMPCIAVSVLIDSLLHAAGR